MGEVGRDDKTDADAGVRRRGLGRLGNLLVIFGRFVYGAGGHLATSRTALQTDRSILISICMSRLAVTRRPPSIQKRRRRGSN
jgi:hypothetical protein